MNFLLNINFYKKTKSAAIHLITLCLLFTFSAQAKDLQCDISNNSQISPAVITSMMKAASNGNLYRIDTETSHVEFQVNHFPFSSVEGHFSHFEGGVTVPADSNLTRQALFLIKAGSITTGDGDIDDYLKSSVFFDAEKFPDILFISTGFEWIDQFTARLYGELTLRGTTRPLIFIARIKNDKGHSLEKNQKMTMLASAEIQRSQFGMQEMQFLVSDTVRFNLKIEASRIGI